MKLITELNANQMVLCVRGQQHYVDHGAMGEETIPLSHVLHSRHVTLHFPSLLPPLPVRNAHLHWGDGWGRAGVKIMNNSSQIM